MRETAPFSWQEASGWLVLSGSNDSLSEIRARALGRCDASGAIAYISFAGDLGDALMDDMAELGATSGYLVDLEEGDNNEIYERLNSAAMIVIEAVGAGDELCRLIRRTAVHAMKDALNRGSLILLEGAAAACAGEFMLDAAGRTVAGLGFVRNALIAADTRDLSENATLRAVRPQMPDAAFIGLAPGAALALGPDRAIETWGERQVSVSLGNLALATAEYEG